MKKGCTVWLKSTSKSAVFEEGIVLEKLANNQLVIQKKRNNDIVHIQETSKDTYWIKDNFQDKTYADNTALTYLSPPNVLHNLITRYNDVMANPNNLLPLSSSISAAGIYTFTGWVLAAINPYTLLPLYTPSIMDLFYGRSITSVPPHPFAVAETAFQQMCATKRSQSILVSGNSGSGKTETTKQLLNYLVYVSRRRCDYSLSLCGLEKDKLSCGLIRRQHDVISSMILSSNVILESFGNCKTVNNDNSSRFGKLIELFFTEERRDKEQKRSEQGLKDNDNWEIGGELDYARINVYLLTKGRITTVPHKERNYHIFYSICCILDPELREWLALPSVPSLVSLQRTLEEVDYPEKKNNKETQRDKRLDQSLWNHYYDDKYEKLEIIEKESARHFHYLLDSHGQYNSCNNRFSLQEILEALTTIGMSQIEQKFLLRILSGIMHLGNIHFSHPHDGGKKDDSTEIAQIPVASLAEKSLHHVCHLLGLEETSFRNALLTRKVRDTTANRSIAEANVARDSIAKTLYSRVFDFITARLNETLGERREESSGIAREQQQSEAMKESKQYSTINILDIFGSEDISVGSKNSLEQLCINFFNEIMHQNFVRSVIVAEEVTYNREGIPWKPLIYHDNSSVLRAFAGAVAASNIYYSMDSSIDQSPMGDSGLGGDVTEKFEKTERDRGAGDSNIISLMNEIGKLPNRSTTQISKAGALSYKDELFRNRLLKEVAPLHFNEEGDAIIYKSSSAQNFFVKHFIGDVEYSSENLIDKNQDTSADFFLELLKKRSDKHADNNGGIPTWIYYALLSNSSEEGSILSSAIAKLCWSRFKETQKESHNRMDKELHDKQIIEGRDETLSNDFLGIVQKVQNEVIVDDDKRTSSRTMFSDFLYRTQIMFQKLKETQSHFIRCLLPNDKKKCGEINPVLLHQQLNYSSIFDVLRIMSQGFPCRVSYDALWTQFSPFLPTEIKERLAPKDFSLLTLEALNISPHLYALGVSKVFFRFGVLQQMDTLQTKGKDPIWCQEFVATVIAHNRKMRWQRMRSKLKVFVRMSLWIRKARARRIAEEAKVYYWDVYYTKLCSRYVEYVNGLLLSILWKRRREIESKKIVKLQSYIRMRLCKKRFLEKKTFCLNFADKMQIWLKKRWDGEKQEALLHLKRYAAYKKELALKDREREEIEWEERRRREDFERERRMEKEERERKERREAEDRERQERQEKEENERRLRNEREIREREMQNSEKLEKSDNIGAPERNNTSFVDTGGSSGRAADDTPVISTKEMEDRLQEMEERIARKVKQEMLENFLTLLHSKQSTQLLKDISEKDMQNLLISSASSGKAPLSSPVPSLPSPPPPALSSDNNEVAVVQDISTQSGPVETGHTFIDTERRDTGPRTVLEEKVRLCNTEGAYVNLFDESHISDVSSADPTTLSLPLATPSSSCQSKKPLVSLIALLEYEFPSSIRSLTISANKKRIVVVLDPPPNRTIPVVYFFDINEEEENSYLTLRVAIPRLWLLSANQLCCVGDCVLISGAIQLEEYLTYHKGGSTSSNSNSNIPHVSAIQPTLNQSVTQAGRAHSQQPNDPLFLNSGPAVTASMSSTGLEGVSDEVSDATGSEKVSNNALALLSSNGDLLLTLLDVVPCSAVAVFEKKKLVAVGRADGAIKILRFDESTCSNCCVASSRFHTAKKKKHRHNSFSSNPSSLSQAPTQTPSPPPTSSAIIALTWVEKMTSPLHPSEEILTLMAVTASGCIFHIAVQHAEYTPCIKNSNQCIREKFSLSLLSQHQISNFQLNPSTETYSIQVKKVQRNNAWLVFISTGTNALHVFSYVDNAFIEGDNISSLGEVRSFGLCSLKWKQLEEQHDTIRKRTVNSQYLIISGGKKLIYQILDPLTLLTASTQSSYTTNREHLHVSEQSFEGRHEEVEKPRGKREEVKKGVTLKNESYYLPHQIFLAHNGVPVQTVAVGQNIVFSGDVDGKIIIWLIHLDTALLNRQLSAPWMVHKHGERRSSNATDNIDANLRYKDTVVEKTSRDVDGWEQVKKEDRDKKDYSKREYKISQYFSNLDGSQSRRNKYSPKKSIPSSPTKWDHSSSEKNSPKENSKREQGEKKNSSWTITGFSKKITNIWKKRDAASHPVLGNNSGASSLHSGGVGSGVGVGDGASTIFYSVKALNNEGKCLSKSNRFSDQWSEDIED